MYRVHGDKIIRRRTNYRKANDIQRYTKILREDFGNMCGIAESKLRFCPRADIYPYHGTA